uniref:Chromo domain-containing protein n=1 Tax=Meloidogyne enterolobii TaxID=390850 RepID=A0A6V7VD90_MELEN|nr:unnamed protein product [Meloidogyne enterolobii]
MSGRANRLNLKKKTSNENNNQKKYFLRERKISPILRETKITCVCKDHKKTKCPEILQKFCIKNKAGIDVLPDEVRNGQAYWTIKKILDKEFDDLGNPSRVLVQWRGFEPCEAEWEPAGVLCDCPGLIYHEGYYDGVVDTIGHVGGLVYNKKVAKLIKNLEKANPGVNIKKIFPKLTQKRNEEMTRQEKQNLRRKLQKTMKAFGKKGLNINGLI